MHILLNISVHDLRDGVMSTTKFGFDSIKIEGRFSNVVLRVERVLNDENWREVLMGDDQLILVDKEFCWVKSAEEEQEASQGSCCW